MLAADLYLGDLVVKSGLDASRDCCRGLIYTVTGFWIWIWIYRHNY
jgi:hypothetical protein